MQALATAAGVVSVAVSLFMFGFQLALGLGAPLGEFAWGGKNKVLPASQRNFCIGMGILHLLGALFIAVRAGFLPIPILEMVTTVFVWVFVLLAFFNTLGNLANQNKKERALMLPLNALSLLTNLLVALFA